MASGHTLWNGPLANSGRNEYQRRRRYYRAQTVGHKFVKAVRIDLAHPEDYVETEGPQQDRYQQDLDSVDMPDPDQIQNGEQDAENNSDSLDFYLRSLRPNQLGKGPNAHQGKGQDARAQHRPRRPLIVSPVGQSPVEAQGDGKGLVRLRLWLVGHVLVGVVVGGFGKRVGLMRSARHRGYDNLVAQVTPSPHLTPTRLGSSVTGRTKYRERSSDRTLARASPVSASM